MRTVKTSQGLTYVAQDTRPTLVDYGREVAARAGLTDDRLSFSNAALDKAGLAALLDEIKPVALRIGRAKDVAADVLAAQNLSGVQRVIIPIISDEQAGQYRVEYAQILTGMGFVENEDRAGSGSLQFDRA